MALFEDDKYISSNDDYPFSENRLEIKWIYMTNMIRTTLLLAGLTGLLLLIGGLVGGRSGMFLALIFSFVMNFGAYWYSDKLVLKMYHAREVTSEEAPDRYSMVQRLAQNAGLPMPRLYIVDTPMP